jgi:KaiC/GvpD/RAD55 family RecA-like ATPase
MVLCPAHADRNPSLHLTLAEDRWLLHCHAGCTLKHVLASAHLQKRDLFDGPSNGHHDEEAVYRYLDETGKPLFEVVRLSGKQFRQRLPNGQWGLNGARRVLYRLPQVLEAIKSGDTIYVVEGERDVLALSKRGLVATCNPGGALKWRREYSEALRGGKVVIVADKDEPGYAHARGVAQALDGIATEISVVECTKGKDISDHLAAGGTLAQLVEVQSATVQPGLRDVAPCTALKSGFDSRKFRVLDVAKLVAETPPEVPWEIDGLAVRGDTTVLTGDPGAGKSLLALTLAGAVARGESIAGIDCSKGAVVYLDAENGGREIHRRLHSLGIPLKGVTVVEADGVDLRNDGDLAGLDSLVGRYQPTMLVLDSLTALWPGANERKTEDVAPTLYELKRLAERHGLAIVLLHHRPKAGGEYRGTTAIAAAAQLGFTLSKAEGDPDRTRRRLHCWKCRPAQEPEDRWLHLDAERGMVLVGSADPYEDPDEPEREAPVRKALAPRFLAALGDGRLGLAEIAGKLDMNPKDGTLRNVAKGLERAGEIARGEDKKYERCKVQSAIAPKGIAPLHLALPFPKPNPGAAPSRA